MEAGGTCLHWSQPFLPHSSSPSKSLTSAIFNPSKNRRYRSGGTLLCRYVHRLERSALFGAESIEIPRSRSGDFLKSRSRNSNTVCSANFDSFSDEEFSKKIQELALRFQLADDDDDELYYTSSSDAVDSNGELESENLDIIHKFADQTPDWTDVEEDLFPGSIERKVQSQYLPLSLRMIQKKLHWQEGFREAGELAYCSVKKAFSSMVFIIQELHSYTMQMRGLLYEDLQGVLARVQKEMNASFVWLFQQVFSSTPTLMVYVMILLANYSVYSMGRNATIAAPPPLVSYASVVKIQDLNPPKFDSSSIKTFSVSPSSGKTISVGGNNGGGGKVRPVSSGTDGDEWNDKADQFRTVIPDGASPVSSSHGTTTGAELTSEQINSKEESSLWNSIVQEASKIQYKDGALDHQTINRLISPVTVKIEPDDHADYLRTELIYQMALREEPNNPLLLANYAQFLWLVPDDRDRAEEYFKRATEVEPADAEAYSKYANFLWRIRNDILAAEATFLGAISADPSNPYYAGTYADFLWDTGAEETCYPLKAAET